MFDLLHSVWAIVADLASGVPGSLVGGVHHARRHETQAFYPATSRFPSDRVCWWCCCGAGRPVGNRLGQLSVAGRATSRLWATMFELRLGSWSLALDLRHWVNEALMAIFFLVVGLEIKREMVEGELRDRRHRVLPIAAAIGGMVLPALLYRGLQSGSSRDSGLGNSNGDRYRSGGRVIAVVGSRVRPSLKLFLLALAIVDDIGAILVIGLVYAGNVEWGWLLVAAAVIGITVMVQGGSKPWRCTWCWERAFGSRFITPGSMPPSPGWRWVCWRRRNLASRQKWSTRPSCRISVRSRDVSGDQAPGPFGGLGGGMARAPDTPVDQLSHRPTFRPGQCRHPAVG